MTANPLPLIALLLAALLCSAADGATTVVVRATITDCNQQRCLPPQQKWGSGVVIGSLSDGSTAILTAGHVVGNGEHHIGWTNSEWIPAKVVMAQVNDDIDIAIVSARLSGVECGTLSESDADQTAVMTGFLPREGWRNQRGRVVEKRLYGVRSEPGESGGPVVDPRTGEIIGIVWGTDGRDSYLTRSVKIRLWLRSRLGYIPSCGQPPRPPVVATPGPQPPQSSKPIVVDVPGCDCKNYDGDIAALRAEIHAMKAPIKVQIQRDGVVIDEDTYDVFRGQPIVLNFRKKTTPTQGAAGNSGGE